MDYIKQNQPDLTWGSNKGGSTSFITRMIDWFSWVSTGGGPIYVSILMACRGIAWRWTHCLKFYLMWNDSSALPVRSPPTDHCVGPIRRYIVSSGRLMIWIGKYIYKRHRHPPPQSPSSLPKCYLFIIIFIIENKFLCGSNSTMVLRMCEEEDDLEYVEATGD